MTIIGKNAFRGCAGLTSVVIGNGVTSIGDDAFSYCTGLTNVIIGKSVTVIGESAFWICEALTRVFYEGTEAEWDAMVIGIYNDSLKNAGIYLYSETRPSSPWRGYWHYDANGKIAIWE